MEELKKSGYESEAYKVARFKQLRAELDLKVKNPNKDLWWYVGLIVKVEKSKLFFWLQHSSISFNLLRTKICMQPSCLFNSFY